MGVTTKESIAATTAAIRQEAPARLQELCDAAKSAKSDVVTLCHSGPVPMPDDARCVNGFCVASSIERQHTEIAISEQMEKFKEYGKGIRCRSSSQCHC
jgi:predicted TIM-barrel enzyme